MKRLAALALSFFVVLSCLPSVFAVEQLHKDISYNELIQIDFDINEFRTLMDQASLLCLDEKNFDRVESVLAQIREQYLCLETLMEIASLDTYRDVTDQAASAQYYEYLELYYEVDRMMLETIPLMMDSPCWEAVDQMDYVFYNYLWATENDEEYDQAVALQTEEQQLVEQYYDICYRDYYGELNGNRFTQTQADQAWSDGSVSDEEYDDLCIQIVQSQNEALAGLYLQLVENRQAQAQLSDCGDPMEYYDDYYYYRDIDKEMRESFYASVKAFIVPLLQKMSQKMSNLYMDMDYCVYEWDDCELLSLAEDNLRVLSPELTEALEYMVEKGYYDISYGENKVEGAFTTMLPYAGAPYLFMQPVGDNYDFSTLIHEFGHYYAFYVSPDLNAFNLELSETHSQGLELLMLSQYEEIYGSGAELEEVCTMYNILVSMVDGCLYDELERYAYGQENLTVEDLNRKYGQLLREYGYWDDTVPEEQGYGWVTVSHLYSNPLYYFSYGVSAAAALEIWSMDQWNYDGAHEMAVDTYLRLVSLGEVGYFQETLEAAGLENPLSKKEIRSLSEEIAQKYALESVQDSASAVTDVVRYIVIGIGAVTYLRYIGAFILVFIIVKKENRNEKSGKLVYAGTVGTIGQGQHDLRCGGKPASSAGGGSGGRESGAADACPAAGDETIYPAEEHETP